MEEIGDSHLFIDFSFQFGYSDGVARQARVVIPGLPHHITQWGNNREDVFFVDGDRVAYLGLLREQCEKHGVRVLGYCLMTNHIHLVATPAREDSFEPGCGADAFSLYGVHQPAPWPERAHLLDLEARNDLVPGVNWKEMLKEGDDKETLAALRLNTQTGRPLVSDSFLSKLERTLGRRLRPLPVGRPEKEKSETRNRRK